MRTLFFLTIMLVFTNCLSASSQIDFEEDKLSVVALKLEKAQKQKILESVFERSKVPATNKVMKVVSEVQRTTLGKCTIKVYAEFDNGVVIEGTVVIEGIPWYECLAIKIYDLFSSNF